MNATLLTMSPRVCNFGSAPGTFEFSHTSTVDTGSAPSLASSSMSSFLMLKLNDEDIVCQVSNVGFRSRSPVFVLLVS